MIHSTPLDANSVEDFLAEDRKKSLLRFATAGSVDDGKSTLIGRLLYEAHAVYEDQLSAVKNSKVNRAGRAIDFSLLTDGLKAEREQGITIDVAYRYFETAKRKFIIADTPGHEQYTRNMATGASTADLAIILIDARHGVLPQSRRHAAIAALLGIPDIVVAVNKIDLIAFDKARFAAIQRDFTAHLQKLGIRRAQFIPISALEGDNVTTRSVRTPWYDGPSLLEYLETAVLHGEKADAPVRFAVQYVVRPDGNFRGYAGEVLGGTLRVGDRVRVLPSERQTRVKSLVAWGGEKMVAETGCPVTVTLEDEIDISRGDMLVRAETSPVVASKLSAMLVWMNESTLVRGRPYLLKQATQTLNAQIADVTYRLNVETLDRDQADTLGLNDIGAVTLETTKPIFFDAYSQNRKTGSFILIDPISNATVAAGMLQSGETTDGAHKQAVAAADRATRYGHGGAVVWVRTQDIHTLEAMLFASGLHTYAPDDVSPILLPDLAVHLCRAGLLVLVSSTPGEAVHKRLSERLQAQNFALIEPKGEDLPATMRALKDAGVFAAGDKP